MYVKNYLNASALNHTVLHSTEDNRIQTTADPSVYNISTIVNITDRQIELENGSIWEVDPGTGNLRVGDKIKLVDREALQKVGTKETFKAWLSDLQPSPHNTIEKIQWVYWAGEVQALITLEDGSKWFFDEFAMAQDWNRGDHVLIFQPDGRNFVMSDMALEYRPIPGIPFYCYPYIYASLATYTVDAKDCEIKDELPKFELPEGVILRNTPPFPLSSS